MFHRVALLAGLMLPALALSQANETPQAPTAPAASRVALHTSLGDIVVELDSVKAPISSRNFLRYVNEGFYNGTTFHRVIDNFMIQGGGYTVDLQQKPAHEPIQNEAKNGLSNLRGTVAMARTGDPHSAAAQFFINVVDNPRLDYVSDASGMTWGYAVFGKVVEGMDVVDKIRALPTSGQGPFRTDVPVTPVTIERAEALAAPVAEAAAQ